VSYPLFKQTVVEWIRITIRFFANWKRPSHAATAYNHAGTARNKAVVNLSLSGTLSSAANAAAAKLVAGGMTVVAAAGNEGTLASVRSPASEPSILTVGSSNSTDARHPSSNFGDRVDLLAPGVGIVSAYHTSDSATMTLTGTSMAAPHVAGLAAYYIRLNSLRGSAVASKILNTATTGALTNLGAGTPNKLAYNNNGF
jgi:aqualysin 1